MSSCMLASCAPGLVAWKAAEGTLEFLPKSIPDRVRCLTASRYRAHERASQGGARLDPPSDGATIFDIQYLDAIAGMLAIGLLTRGAANRFGRLIDQLGDRSFLQVKIDPTWTLKGRDIVAEQLGIPEGHDPYFSFCTIARRDPDRGAAPCHDCERFRGHRFTELRGHPARR